MTSSRRDNLLLGAVMHLALAVIARACALPLLAGQTTALFESFEYDEAGRLERMTDNAGKVTRYEYDAAGRPWKTVFHDGTYTETTYDLLGRKTAQRDQAGIVTKFGYDELGRLTKVTDALGHETRYAYDELGNMTSTVDAEQHETKLAYDKLGRLTTRTLPPVNGQSLSESFGYDAAGNLSTHQRFDGTQITYEHDLDGRVTKKVSPEKTYFFHWSPGGQLQTVGDDPCNPSDAYGTFVYDARGRLGLERREDGDKLVYAYDPGGNRTDAALAPRWEDPNKPTWKTHYEYDGLNRLKTVSEVLDPNGSATSKAIGEYFYDAVGNLDHVTLGNGTAVEYGYDNLHRLTSVKNYRDYGGTKEVISSFTYTLGDAGNRTAVVEQLSDDTRRTISYTYDDLYRLKQEWADTRDPNGLIVHERQVDYVYDNVGNRKTMTVRETAGGTTARYTVNYDYDAHDRLTGETRSGSCLTAAMYARDRSEYAVARSAQPVPARWAGPALLGFGLITLVCTVFPLISRSWRPLRSSRLGGCLYGRRYERRRLFTACVSLFFVPQFIIGASNLLGLHVEGLEAQALADTTGCSRTVTYQYDDNGNLHGRTVTVGTQVTERNLYVFNSEDRLVVFDPQFDPNAPAGQYSAGATHYTYDQDGVRTSKTTGGVTTYYVVDKNRDLPQVLEEREQRSGVTTLKVRYIYGHDLLAQVRPGAGGSLEYSYYHYDGQLSTRQLTDGNADPAQVAVTNNYSYDAFGADLTHLGLPGNAVGAPENPYRYTGEQHDPATGFYYLRARYYDPGTGRFASRDPFGGFNSDPMTLHKYLYCGANPIDRADPSGRMGFGGIVLIGLAIVALVLLLVIPLIAGAIGRYGGYNVSRTATPRRIAIVTGDLGFWCDYTMAYNATSVTGLAADARSAGHIVTEMRNPNETQFIGVLNSNELVLVVSHGPPLNLFDQRDRPISGMSLGGTATDPTDTVFGYGLPVDRRWITANELDGKVSNSNLVLVAAGCNLGSNTRLYDAVRPRYFVGTAGETNSANIQVSLKYVARWLNGENERSLNSWFLGEDKRNRVSP